MSAPQRSHAFSLPSLLCVDDDKQILAGLTDVLRRKFDVTTATSGSEGLRLLVDRGPFTLVLSDFAMPGMNGAQFLTQVRHAAPGTVRLLLTGQATLDDAIAAVNDGNIVRFLKKPSSPPDLRQVQIRLDLPTEALVVPVSRSALEQVLVNLVKNAIDALTELQRPDPLIAVCARRTRDGLVELSIADNGCGIPEATLPLLFEPYYTTKPPDRGTGLGLFVVRDIIRSAGGDVLVQSQRGQGATFTLTLPVARVPAAIAATASRVPSLR